MKRGKRSFQLDHEQEYDQYELDNGSNPNPPTGGGNLPSLGELEKLIEEGKKKVETATSQGVENLENTAKEETKKIQDVIAGGTDILKKSTEQLNELSTQLEGALTQHAQEKIGKIDEAFLTQKTQIGESINKGIENIKSTAKTEKDAITQLATTETEKLEQLAKKKADEVVGAFDAEKKEIKDTLSTGKDEITQLITTGKEEIEELADKKIDEIKKAAGGKPVKTMETISDQSLIYGIAWQEVEKDSDGNIIKYGDLFVRGEKRGDVLGTGDTTGYRSISCVVECDLFLIMDASVFMRPVKGKGHDNSIFVFGWNHSGIFGIGNTNNATFPMEVKFDSRVKQFGFCGTETASRSSVVLLENGDLYAAGTLDYIGLGNSSTPNFKKINSDITKIHSGGFIGIIAEKESGNIAWGHNENNIFGFSGQSSANSFEGTPLLAMFYRSGNAYVSYCFSKDGSRILFSGDNRYNVNPDEPSTGNVMRTELKTDGYPILIDPAIGDTIGGELCAVFRGEINGTKGFFAIGDRVSKTGGFSKKVKKLDIPYCDGVVVSIKYKNFNNSNMSLMYIFSQELKKLWEINVYNNFSIKEIILPSAVLFAEKVEVRQFFNSSDTGTYIALIADNEIWIFSNQGANRGDNTNHAGRFNLLRRG